MENAIIGRKAEIERLNKYIASDRSEFIAIYGRRRVGKTFLIKAPLPKTIVSRCVPIPNLAILPEPNIQILTERRRCR